MSVLKYICLLLMCVGFMSELTAKDELDLSGVWRFSTDEKYETNEDWRQSGFDRSDWELLTVPGSWETENKYAHFSGTAYYVKELKLPSDWNQNYVRLCFEAVYQKAEVWFNGKYLGEHVGGYTPFEFDVTSRVKFGEVNTLAVSVNDRYNRGAWWKWGGISRNVYLAKENKLRISRHKIIAEPNLDNGESHIDAELFIKNYSGTELKGYVESQVFDRYGEESFGNKSRQEFSINPNSETDVKVSFKLDASETKLWDLDNPNLYRLFSKIYVNGKQIDEANERFGIRKIEAKNAQLLLNGKVVKANGFNRVSTHRAYGQSEPEHLIKFDIDAMMAMGARMTRINHHAQSPFLLDYCDEVGMLIIEEIPVWGKTDPQVKPDNPLTKQWLKETIERDFNHPSIIGWSVGNELAEKNLKGQQMSWKVYEYVRTMIEYVGTLDPTRLKTYVSNTATGANGPGIDPDDVCDILCHNSYGGVIDQVKKLKKIWPDKPVFVTELGKGQPGEYLEDSKLKDSLIADIKKLKEFDHVVGYSIWSYNDYRSHFGGTPLSENRAWGMYNVWRQPKAAAYEIRELMTGIKKDDKPLPVLVPIPEHRPKGKVYIEAIEPMKNSCMVGFSVIDKDDNYEIGCKRAGSEELIFTVNGVRGAAKISDMMPGKYSFRIRGVKGEWSPVYDAVLQ